MRRRVEREGRSSRKDERRKKVGNGRKLQV